MSSYRATGARIAPRRNRFHPVHRGRFHVDRGRLRGLDGVKKGVSTKPCRRSRYDRKDFCGFPAHPRLSTNQVVYGRTEGEWK